MNRLWLLAALVPLAHAEHVIVRPTEIHGILVNPGMGITTFQRYNGEPLYPGLRWSEAGPTEPLPAVAAKPVFPETTIAYCRWHWITLEPEKGKVRWEILDTALEQARLHGQALAIRLMPYDQQHPVPDWYRNSGARRANAATEAIWEPDFSDPMYLKHWNNLIAAAGARYDGHPALESVDISSVGYWGEGWSDFMPALEHQKALIDIYFKAFPRTLLLMNFDEPDALAYGTSRGAGWRFDCLGDMRPKFSHMLDFYPQQIARTGIQDVWRRSPVVMETCGTPGSWKQSKWDVHYILTEALRWHVSSLNVKSTAIPPEWQREFDDFQSKMGYRFALRRIEFEDRVKAGSMLPLKSWWVNEGVAPVYREYRLAFELTSPEHRAQILTTTDVSKWLPGDAVFDELLAIPADLPAGAYRLRTALLDLRTGKPAIRLAIEGREPDGWYPLGKINVVR